ncbi:MAG: transglycosylase SLT domain-containing protein [Nitrospirae bacterium]|nr:transglycosylase SLT domain-containing protein [Nitrospirota bacterium]
MARTSIERGAADEALDRLTLIRSQWPDTVWAGRSAFWIAKLAVERDANEAVSWGLRASSELPLVGDHALVLAAEAARRAEQPERAARLLDLVVRRYPDSPLVPGALTGSADLWSRVPGGRTEAIGRWRELIDRFPQHAAVPSALAALGDALVAEGRAAEAGLAYRRLRFEFGAAPEAATIEERLDHLIRNGEASSPTFEERRRRAEALTRAARYAEGLEAWSALRRSAPTPAARRDIALQVGVTLYRLRRWDDAWAAFHALGASAMGSAEAHEDALLWEGRTSFRRENEPALRRAEATLGKEFPQSPNRLELIALRAAWHRGRGEQATALAVYRAMGALATVMHRPDKLVEAQWYVGWLEYRRGALAAAREAFERGLAAAQPSDPQIPQLLYWMGRLDALRGRPDAARATIAEVEARFPYTYYGYLARHGLRWSADDRRPDVVPVAAPASASDETLDADRVWPAVSSRAAELWALGLRAQARDELLAALHGAPPPLERVSDAVELLAKVGADGEALRLLRRQFGSALERGEPALPRAIWEGAYPAHLLEPIRHAGTDRVDPFLVTGLIREESVYDSNAVSPVGAIGLMQLMPETARRVARAVGLTSFAVDQLFTPEVNITLGVRYLADLLDRFAGNEAYAVAAYNAGPEAVVKWIESSSPRALDEFVEEIPFPETRWYVKRVLRSTWEYRALYGAPSTSVIVPTGSLHVSGDLTPPAVAPD